MCNACADAIDYRFWSASGYAFTLHHHRHNGIEQDHFGDARRSMARDVAGQLPASRRMPHQYCAAKIESIDELIQIVGPGVNIVAGTRLIGIAVTPPIVGDRTVPLSVEKQHLCFPRRAGQRPAVRENDRRSGAPITVVNRSTVTGSDPRHGLSPLLIERPLQKARRDGPYPTRARRRRYLRKMERTLSGEMFGMSIRHRSRAQARCTELQLTRLKARRSWCGLSHVTSGLPAYPTKCTAAEFT